MLYPEQRRIIQSLLTPQLRCQQIEDIPLQALYDRGYIHLLLDLDNTILSPRYRDVSLRSLNWVSKAQSIGFDVWLISNNHDHYRVARAAKQLGIRGLYRANKPSSIALREYAKQHNIDLKSSVVVGDQLLTDVLVANWVRAYSIWVSPLDRQLTLIKTLQKEFETWLFGVVQSS